MATSPPAAWLAELAKDRPIGGVAGPGRWLVASYVPTALFSLKASTATSSVAKTLLVPTVYAIKMALVDAAFRAGLDESACGDLVRSLIGIDVRIAPPEKAVVTNTFVKIRQESRAGDPLRPYGPNIAYREFVHYKGQWRWAFDLGGAEESVAEQLAFLVRRVNYVGKRGSFVQFVGVERRAEVSAGFTLPLPPSGPWHMPNRSHAAILDDFGSEAELGILSSFNSAQPKRERHRRFVQTLVPIGIVSTGPGFSEYES